MTREQLLAEIEDILMLDSGSLDINKQLEEYEDWDSLAHLNLIALFDKKLNIKLDANSIKEIKTSQDILNKANL